MADLKVSTVLMAARDLINEPQKWTKRYYAKDINGAPISELSSFACSFCTMGALYRTLHDARPRDWAFNLNEASSKLQTCIDEQASFRNVVEFNDAPTTTHEAVLKIFDSAIKLAKQQEEGAQAS